MTRMDYLIGMLWARGSIRLNSNPYMEIEIGIRDVFKQDNHSKSVKLPKMPMKL